MKNVNLTKGPITRKLIVLAVPLIAANLMQMAYNFTDMFFVGRYSSEAVVALATAGFYLWLASGLILLAKTGMEVLVGQSYGKKDHDSVALYIRNGLVFSFVLSITMTIIFSVFSTPLIEIFGLSDLYIKDLAIQYLIIISFALFFISMGQSLTSIFQALGNTKTIFIYSAIGLVVNIILDPIFILYLDWGVKGAAFATLIASMIPTSLFILTLIKKTDYLQNFFKSLKIKAVKDIFKISKFVAINSISFTFIAMIISIRVIEFGDKALGAQRIGANLESFSWLIGTGIATSISVFAAQNYGAKHYHRLLRGYYVTILMMSAYGVIVGTVFLFFGGNLISIFTTDSEIINFGAQYMIFISFSQVFMLLEGISSGVFNGIGKTVYPAFFSISGNLGRLALVFILSSESLFGLNGIWIAISVSSIYKGLGITSYLLYFVNKSKDFKLKYLTTPIDPVIVD